MMQSETWIRELVRFETEGIEEALERSPSYWIDKSSIEFLQQLRSYLAGYLALFNKLLATEDPKLEIKLFPLAQSEADFMLFRSPWKLIFSNPGHGVILIQGSPHGKAQASESHFETSHELLASLGPLKEVRWLYQGELIESEKIARFFFSEFVRATRPSPKEKRQLIREIKALLQEKGLEL